MRGLEAEPRIPPGKEALDINAAAERLRLPVASLERALERKFVDGYRGGDGKWYVLLDTPLDLSRMDDQGGNGPEPDMTGLADRRAAAPGRAVNDAPEVDEFAEAAAGAEPDVRRLAELVEHLAEEVRYLRRELSQRDKLLLARDDTIDKLLQHFAEVNQQIVKRVPSADLLQIQMEQAHQSQRQITERHERELTSVKDVLISLQDFLARSRRPPKA